MISFGGALCSTDEIRMVMAESARQCARMDLCSYYAGHGDFAAGIMFRQQHPRIIVGGIGLESRAAQLAAMTRSNSGQVRYLEGCHVKLYIFHFHKMSPRAIVGSMNLGQGMPHELAMLVSHAAHVRRLITCYNTLWTQAQTINSLDMGKVAKSLSSGSFDDSEASRKTAPVVSSATSPTRK